MIAKRISSLWLLWVVACCAITAKLFLWEIEYFKSPGEQFYRAALAGVPVLAAMVAAYAWLRRTRIWQFEPLIFAAAGLGTILIYEPRALLANAALFVAAHAVGSAAARALKIELESPSERLAVFCGGGIGLLIPVFVLMGSMRWLALPAIVALLLLLVPAGLWKSGILRDLRLLYLEWSRSADLTHTICGITIAFGFVALICTLLVALAPPITFDTLFMHLPSVQVYAKARSIVPIPEIEYSYYPQGGETLWTIAYILAGTAGVQAECVFFFAIFLLVVFRIARECGCGAAGSVAGTLWAATLPFLHWTGSVVKNDLLMTMFQGLALYGFLRWLHTRRFSWISAGVFFLAQSFGVKHVALFGAVPLVLLFAYAVWKQPRRLRAALAMAALFAIFGTFWALRTYALKGNPVYPMAVQQATRSADAGHGSSSTGIVRRYAALPLRILFDGIWVFESPLPSPAGIVLLAFLPLGLWALWDRRNPAGSATIFFTLVYFLYWAFVMSSIRYAILPFAILAILAAQGAVRFFDESPGPILRLSVTSLAVYCLMTGILGIMIIEVNAPQIRYFAGRTDRAGYLRAALRTYRSLEFLRASAKQDDEIFGVDNCSRAYAPDPVRFQCVLCPQAGCSSGLVRRGIESYQPQFVIVPESGSEPRMLIDGPDWKRVYVDDFFSVYRHD